MRFVHRRKYVCLSPNAAWPVIAAEPVIELDGLEAEKARSPVGLACWWRPVT